LGQEEKRLPFNNQNNNNIQASQSREQTEDTMLSIKYINAIQLQLQQQIIELTTLPHQLRLQQLPTQIEQLQQLLSLPPDQLQIQLREISIQFQQVPSTPISQLQRERVQIIASLPFNEKQTLLQLALNATIADLQFVEQLVSLPSGQQQQMIEERQQDYQQRISALEQVKQGQISGLNQLSSSVTPSNSQ
jgi:hypothetical protein